MPFFAVHPFASGEVQWLARRVDHTSVHMGAEGTSRREDWDKAFASLPKERQELLLHWFAIQELIIDVLELPELEWWELIQWALENPGDFSFVDDFPDRGAADSAEVAERLRTRRLLAQQSESEMGTAHEEGAMGKKASGKGLDKELFKNFVTMRRA